MENFILSVIGALILILLSIIGYFVKTWIESTSKQWESASKQWIESTSALTRAVHELKTTVAVITSNQGNSDKACSTTHQLINTRLNAHSERINQHGEAIIELQTITETARKKHRTIKTDES